MCHTKAMPSVEKLPSGKYRAIYRGPDGKRRSAGTFTHKKLATTEAASAEVKAHATGWRDPKSAQRTWGEWCEEWWPTRAVEPGTLKREEYNRDLHLLPKWGDVRLVDITRFDVKAWAAELKKSGLAPATVLKRVYLLSASLSAAIDKEILVTNPAFRIKLPGGETDVRRFLTRDEAADVLAQFRPPVDRPTNEALVSTLLGTGMRWGEAAGLQVRRVNLLRGQVTVAEVWDDEMRQMKGYPKGRQIRDVPIPDWVAPLLEREIDGRSHGFVFRQDSFVLDYANWRKRFWLPAVEHAGHGPVRISDLRHTYASWLLQDEDHPLSLAEIGLLLGHVSEQTTAIYAKLAAVPDQRVHAILADPSAPRRGTNVGRRGTVSHFERLQSTGT